MLIILIFSVLTMQTDLPKTKKVNISSEAASSTMQFYPAKPIQRNFDPPVRQMSFACRPAHILHSLFGLRVDLYYVSFPFSMLKR